MKRYKQLICTIMLLFFLVASPVLAQSDQPPPPNEQDAFPYKLYLPQVFRPSQFSLSGKVTDENGYPIQNITLTSASGQKAITDSIGNYTILGLPSGPNAVSPAGENLAFVPGVQEVNINSNVNGINFIAITLKELIVNGGFENNTGWTIPVTEYTAGYTTSQVHNGSRAMRTGIVSGTNRYSYSTVNQKVTIPSGAVSARLNLWLYPQSTETSLSLAEAPVFGDKPVFSEATETSDAQYVMILDANGKILETMIWMRSNNRFWTRHEFNVTRWAGRTITIHIGTYNDGRGGITAMFADEVSLIITKDTTPPPVTCANALSNSGFESNTAWNIPATSYSAGYSTARFHSGSRSMRTGIVNPSDNIYSYSDAWQFASIPSNAISAKIKMWYFPISTEVASLGEGIEETSPPEMPQVETIDQLQALALADDVQYLLVLDTNGNILQTLFWIKSNASSWKYLEINVLQYKGKTIRLQFGTGNEGTGGVTAMYVDDMYAEYCTGDGGTDPTECTNLMINGGFENNQAWYMPVTPYTAGYSTAFYRSGSRSMRTGIYYESHNRYAYSDARQAVKLPKTLSKARLSFYIKPNTTAAWNDVQYVILLDQWGNWIDTLVWQLSNLGWTYREFNLLNYAGETIQVNFGTYNDGFSGVTSLYVDDVRLDVCP